MCPNSIIYACGDCVRHSWIIHYATVNETGSPFFKQLESVLRRGHSLTIEITEGALINTKQSEEVLRQLKEHDLNIHLDDFGTGYSSLSYLNKYHIDTLKIDRSFMKEVNLSEKGEKITTIIIHLAHTLGLNVIAEGVEEIEQIQFLKDKNAVYTQGYYFNKPLSVQEMELYYLKERKK